MQQIRKGIKDLLPDGGWGGFKVGSVGFERNASE